MILFHGTDSVRLRAIEREGLREPVFLTDDFEIAYLFARQFPCPPNPLRGHPVVLTVRVPDTDRLVVDYAMYEQPVDAIARKYGQEEEDPSLLMLLESGDFKGPADRYDWRTSLEQVSSVVYEGRIPRENVLFVRNLECPKN